MSGVILIYTLVGDEAAALSMARILLEERLIACANLLAPATSCYEWKGQMALEPERPLILKTTAERREAALARLAALHPYELPAITSWEAGASTGFAAWVAEQTGAGMRAAQA